MHTVECAIGLREQLTTSQLLTVDTANELRRIIDRWRIGATIKTIMNDITSLSLALEINRETHRAL